MASMRIRLWLAMAIGSAELVGCSREKSEAKQSEPAPPATAAPTAEAHVDEGHSAPEPIPSPSVASGETAPKKLEDLERELESAKDDAQRKQLQEQLEQARRESGAHSTPPSAPKSGGRCAPGDPLCDPFSGPEPPKEKDKKPRAPMLASTKSLTDRVTAAELDEIVGSNIRRFVPCTKTDVVIAVHAVISPEGRVLEATCPTSDPEDAKTRDCVAKAFAALTFPKSQGSRPSPVTFDLSLKPQEL